MSRSTIPSKRSADAQEDAWVADEDRFVLQQTRTKAMIRAKNGRAEPIDWLTVILTVIDPEKNPMQDELDDGDLEMIDPETLFDQLSTARLSELEKKIDFIKVLESSKSNIEYWNMMKTICRERQDSAQDSQSAAKSIGAIATDLDKLLRPKTLADLEKLEKQVRAKLASNESIDTDYWENLLKSLLIYKAKAKLKSISKAIVTARLSDLRKQQALDAEAMKLRLQAKARPLAAPRSSTAAADRHQLDPEPLLRLQPQDKALLTQDIATFTEAIVSRRQEIMKGGYVKSNAQDDHSNKRLKLSKQDQTQSLSAAFDREVARGLGDGEEIFTAEEDVITKGRELWADSHRPRKPQYFNRVMLGFEWNKYNQTHFDQENPPPKVVQGYKFNIFYPDLVNKNKAPTYRIERENGRRRGESTAPAGEDDTCLIHFIAGAPYEDVAFRIVDKEWDHSAKWERGFKSSFDKGVLQLQFQFKKVYYRK